ncbi:MAG TPA: cellulose binding domain-containing protein [Actinoplanes sp.]|nr:cellulose binding domain-containing protein [Actinoplanes sp.]
MGCPATYTATHQWSRGIGASVTVANLGNPLNGWTLTLGFADAEQQVVQGWNAAWAQAGARR